MTPTCWNFLLSFKKTNTEARSIMLNNTIKVINTALVALTPVSRVSRVKDLGTLDIKSE